MLVSAINAVNTQSSYSQSSSVVCVNSRGSDLYTDSELAVVENTISTKDKSVYVLSSNKYNNVFEWHNFCNSQILKGKLDIIA